MTKYYIGGTEVTEAEALELVGNESTRTYVRKVYREEMNIADVPEELRESVSASVAARIARHGEYEKQEVTAEELKQMIEGAV